MKQWIKKHIDIIGYGLIVVLVLTAIIVISIVVVNGGDNKTEGKRYIPQGDCEYALMDLGSTNCDPCVRLQPELAALREEYGDKIDVVFFDITYTQEGAAMANGYKVNIMPTLLFVNKDGQELKRVVGFHTKEQIEDIFRELGWL